MKIKTFGRKALEHVGVFDHQAISNDFHEAMKGSERNLRSFIAETTKHLDAERPMVTLGSAVSVLICAAILPSTKGNLASAIFGCSSFAAAAAAAFKTLQIQGQMVKAASEKLADMSCAPKNNGAGSFWVP